MDSGRLRDRVTIQKPPTTLDNYGQQVSDWVDVKTRNCSIEPINGREYWTAGPEAAQNSVRVRFRYEKNLLRSGYRLLDYRTSPATVYDIEGAPIDPSNEHIELICMCKVRQ